MTILFAIALNLFAPAPVLDTDGMVFAAGCNGQPLNPRTSPRPMPRPKGI